MNGACGEVALVAGDRKFCLCLTLGALAELETAFSVTSLAALAARLRALSQADVPVILSALLRGGGEHDAARDVAALNVSAATAADAIAETFKRGLA